MSDIIATCPGCGQKNRIPKHIDVPKVPRAGNSSVRCGKCKRFFTEVELIKEVLASTFGSMGANSIQWLNDDGTLAHEINIKRKP